MGGGAGKQCKTAPAKPGTASSGGEAAPALVLCGPVLGTVTETTAHVLLEVDEDVLLTCVACPVLGGAAVSATLRMPKGEPAVFCLTDLTPGTEYSVSFAPLAFVQQQDLKARGCVLRTMPPAEKVQKLRLLALSCNWPEQLSPKDENPWGRVAEACKSGCWDVVLHLGDQVYTWANGSTRAAQRNLSLDDASADPAVRAKMSSRAVEHLQESYRSTWSHTETASALAHASHLMIWSDNDVTNDFTILRKPDGSQEYAPAYLRAAMGVYHMYQRQLWDPRCLLGPRLLGSKTATLEAQASAVEEWHFHRYGPFGVFLIDMRGNRIDANGALRPGLPPLLSERQRRAIEGAFAEEGLRCMVLCAEIPFVGEDPATIKEKAEKLAFLKDHWPHQLDELLWILDLCFAFKAASAGREVLMLAGDIHVSVESVIRDESTGQEIRHVTTSPITNVVGDFHPALSGKLSERYSYTHKPIPGHRSFCKVDLSVEGGAAKAEAELVCVPASH